ncbi:MAG: RNA polymerase sigma factor RpoH [Rhodospirillales bacterium]|jgi:RNA polymerase sigma-32 factor|nr:RNA polymerase sigma factor RpoH [Rhodospirillales bacterium]HIJ42830.1 RNA polymerase sigma factor RpoH [Rhodospirillaceae bacterium]MDP7214730.1 RNA polymerase sigma factor RpoH [Rhodospirillales bacterium]HIJ45404.1 RNA polymerase sigma factor RpoH [Rhodospirillaceae bacterium]HIJ92795.1 RNA polymerase sigma factor RpoH [Rhodospirillaceae bacterium]
MAALTLPIVPMEKGLSRYFREAWSFPILEPQEEYMLARRWRQHDDVDAAHKLVTSHLRLVAKIAMNYRGYGLPVADLVSEGNIGLMKAVKKFEPERGFRLSTYAMWWVKAAITEYILRSWSVVKMGTTAAQKKLFFSLRKQKNRLRIMDFGDLDSDQAAELAAVMQVSEKEVVNMNRRLAALDVSLNAPLTQSEDESLEFQDLLVDEAPSPETQTAESEEGKLRRKFLKQALAKLPERERNILVERRLTEDPVTLKELGKVYGISRERVRQLEVRAFEKVKSLAETAAGGANRET